MKALREYPWEVMALTVIGLLPIPLMEIEEHFRTTISGYLLPRAMYWAPTFAALIVTSLSNMKIKNKVLLFIGFLVFSCFVSFAWVLGTIVFMGRPLIVPD